MQWDLLDVKQVLKTVPFTVEALTLKDKEQAGPAHPYHRLNCPDWVNILPLTARGTAILIRQSRAGPLADVLEVPGGVIDPGEKDPTMAALRELEEESGYTCPRILPLATMNPNPAIMTNKVHMFVGLGCAPNPNRRHFPDESEKIEVVEVAITDLDRIVRTGEMNSCLSALTVCLASKYFPPTHD